MNDAEIIKQQLLDGQEPKEIIESASRILKIGDKVIMVKPSCRYGGTKREFEKNTKTRGYAIVEKINKRGDIIEVAFPDSQWTMKSDEVELYKAGQRSDGSTKTRYSMLDYATYVASEVNDELKELGSIWNFEFQEIDEDDVMNNFTAEWVKDDFEQYIHVGVTVYGNVPYGDFKNRGTMCVWIQMKAQNSVGLNTKAKILRCTVFHLTKDPKRDAIEINGLAGEIISEIDMIPAADILQKYFGIKPKPAGKTVDKQLVDKEGRVYTEERLKTLNPVKLIELCIVNYDDVKQFIKPETKKSLGEISMGEMRKGAAEPLRKGLMQYLKSIKK